MSSTPLVSVVTPVRNTAPYLAECIESVLAQSYGHFEYIISDNCSTDESYEIAERYAKLDPRIRLIRQPESLGQVQHYNNVLTHISGESKYCKVVQADDHIFPDCLRLMVDCFQQSSSIGLVSSYCIWGKEIWGVGYPYPKSVLPGKEIGRMSLLEGGPFAFGSPTTVMYRSSIVRESPKFFAEALLHEDTEKCMEILQTWDFGFVHQVLSFLRTDNVNESVTTMANLFAAHELDRYIIVQRFAPAFLDEDEAAEVKKKARKEYYSAIAYQAVRWRSKKFWDYHHDGLRTVNESMAWPYLSLRIAAQLLDMAANPGTTVTEFIRHFKKHKRGTEVAKNLANRYQSANQ